MPLTKPQEIMQQILEQAMQESLKPGCCGILVIVGFPEQAYYQQSSAAESTMEKLNESVHKLYREFYWGKSEIISKDTFTEDDPVTKKGVQ